MSDLEWYKYKGKSFPFIRPRQVSAPGIVRPSPEEILYGDAASAAQAPPPPLALLAKGMGQARRKPPSVPNRATNAPPAPTATSPSAPIQIAQSKIPKNTPAQQKRADSTFGDFRKRLAPREGGYVNRGLQKDPGGPTNKGISQKFLNDLRTNKATRKQWRHLPAQTKNLTNAQIDDILRKEFFDRPQIDRLERVPGLARAEPTLAEQIFDASVLHGTAVAGKWLQHSLDEVLGTNLKVANKTTGKHEYDGTLGSDTRRKVEQAVRQGKSKEICNKIVDKRLAYMRANPRLKDNRGWIPRAE
ncbi:MAG TPA: glycosyl hydrolase 108 family protein, partial [Rhodospirillales bacterium]|nr:glycosyl hydrolase 108 family protein [Rhodospirillales bacterium]